MLSYLYPRIDTHVSTTINHLLKSPFCVHPKTGNICVPFDPNHYQSFILDDVPTLTKAIHELGSSGSREKQIAEDRMQDDKIDLNDGGAARKTD